MGKDYSSRSNSKKSTRPAGTPGWVWAFVGLTAGLLVATGLYLKKPLPQSGRALPAEERGAEQDDTRFDFYEMLPNYEVKVPGRTESDPPPRDPTQVSGAYVIQAGSFRTFEDADRLKASMAMLGVESHIEKSPPDTNGHSWYRVRTSPEKDQTVVNEQLRLLRENRIEGVVIKAN
jgi:cell division protein FtsN